MWGLWRCAGYMRYGQGGGLTAEGRRRRERVRVEAARRFEPGVPSAVIAAEMGSVSGRCGGGGRPGRPVLRLPAYAPDLDPVEGILSVLQLGVLTNLAGLSSAHPIQVHRHGLEVDPVPAWSHRRLPRRNRHWPWNQVKHRRTSPIIDPFNMCCCRIDEPNLDALARCRAGGSCTVPDGASNVPTGERGCLSCALRESQLTMIMVASSVFAGDWAADQGPLPARRRPGRPGTRRHSRPAPPGRWTAASSWSPGQRVPPVRFSSAAPR